MIDLPSGQYEYLVDIVSEAPVPSYLLPHVEKLLPKELPLIDIGEPVALPATSR